MHYRQSRQFISASYLASLSLKSVHQGRVGLDQAWVLLGDELNGCDNLGSGLVLELLGWLTQNGCEDGDELWGERDDSCVLVLIYGSSLAGGIEMRPGENLHNPAMQVKMGSFSS